MRAQLEGRFAATVRGAARPDGWPPFALPPAIRETMVAAAERGALLDGVVAHYCERMPSLLIEQSRPDDAARGLLHRPLATARLPKLRAALDGLYAALGGAGLDAAAFVGAPSPPSLLAARPTLGALYAHTLFGSGLPLIGLYPTDRGPLVEELARGDADAILDRALSCHIVHELCHGRSRSCERAPAPWIVAEAAAAHLGASARAAHLFPDEPGEALRGVARFVLLGDALARRFGAGDLWRVATGAPTAALFGERVAAALDEAAWQSWQARPEAPFARDASDALDWIKLVELARGRDFALDCRHGPSLLARAAAVPWRALPWWRDEPGDGDRSLSPRAVAALFQVNAMAPAFVTRPSEPPGARLLLDVEAATLSAERRADGVFDEPATWLWPPPLARRLDERGARRVRIEGATRARRGAIATALLELCDGGAPLPTEVVLSWPSSR